MNDEKQIILVSVQKSLEYLARYEARDKKLPIRSAEMFMVAASHVRFNIEAKVHIRELRALGDIYPTLQGMLADVIWDSRITRNRAQHCPELHALMERITK